MWIMAFHYNHGLVKFAGYIPDELRDDFDQELPIADLADQRRAYSSTWLFGEQPTAERLHPDIQHLMPCINIVIRLGGLSLTRDNQHLNVDVVQAHSDILSATELGWHKDGFGGFYRRAIVSNRDGVMCKGIGGGEIETPDYGIAVIDGMTEHSPRFTSTQKRTRLRVTRMDPFAD